MQILITNFWLNEFDDSESFCFEFIDHCKARGHKVDMYALDISSKMRAYCVDNGITLYDPHTSFGSMHYDLIWMHHNVLPRDSFMNSKSSLTASSVVSHHMSAFEPNDIPLFPQAESVLADRILARSFDVKFLLTELGFEDKLVSIVGSPAPMKFTGYESSLPQLNKFLFISNNPPKNMLAAADMLETIGFEVKRIERSQFVGDRNWMAPEDFKWADAIISIEETIPYSVLSHRPIYLYNKYSGLGWVTEDSELNVAFLREQKSNIDVKALSVSAIIEQLLSGYEDARLYINSLDQESTQKFQFESVLDQILLDLSSSIDPSVNSFDKIAPAAKVSWLAVQDMFIREIQARKFAEGSAKQALLERSIVIEKLQENDEALEALTKRFAGKADTDLGSEISTQRKFSISGLIQK
jgi:hypothetical protein